MYAPTGPGARTQLVKRHQSDVLAEHGGPFLLSNSFFPCLLLKKETGRMRRAQMCNYTTRLRRSDKFNPAPELLKHLFHTAPADVTNR